MKVWINGEEKEVKDEIPLLALLGHFQLPHQGIAVELNRQVVAKASWGLTQLKQGDVIEIIQALGGG